MPSLNKRQSVSLLQLDMVCFVDIHERSALFEIEIRGRVDGGGESIRGVRRRDWKERRRGNCSLDVK